jgi:antitoxin (DNA-binding transcriptional repressor) of toxin-antitoxin stability system
METISIQEAESHLSRYLDAAEKGEEFVVVRGKKAIARIIPPGESDSSPRPKVGEYITAPFDIPDVALAPLTKDELKAWGL